VKGPDSQILDNSAYDFFQEDREEKEFKYSLFIFALFKNREVIPKGQICLNIRHLSLKRKELSITIYRK